jgi:hypothetical protein
MTMTVGDPVEEEGFSRRQVGRLAAHRSGKAIWEKARSLPWPKYLLFVFAATRG